MPDFNDGQWDLVDVAVAQLEKSWNRKEPADFQTLLPPAGHPSRTLILAELIKIDQEWHWRSGKPKFLENYLSEWPEFQHENETVRELLEAECATRAALNSMPSREALRERFPNLAADIDLDRIARETVGHTPVAPADKPLQDRETSALNMENTPIDHRPGGDLKIGAMFGRYEILEVLGIGGMGKIYRAKDSQFPREVALKIPHLDKHGDDELLMRFKREAQAAAKITHPHVCPIYDAGEIDNILFITMAFIRGENLAARIKINEVQNRLSNQRETAEVVLKIAQALEAVHHAGLIHRDIKPSNVMIDAQSGQPLLMDFGLVRETVAAKDLTQNNAAPGTLAYMSPEQIDGKAEPRSDLYSLGVVLYEAVTGKRPFEGGITELVTKIAYKPPPPPRTIRPDLEPALESINLKALAKKPEDRYQSAADMAADLKRYLRGQPQSSSAPPRRRGRFGLLAAAAATAILLFAWIAMYFGKPVKPGLASLNVSRWIETDPNIDGICVSKDGATLYAAYWANKIQQFDVPSGKILRNLSSDDQDTHGGVALSADERLLFTTNYYKNFISRFDSKRDYESQDLPISDVERPWAREIGVTPDRERLVVGVGMDGRSEDLRNDRISIIDVAGNAFSVLGDVPLPDEPAIKKIGFSSNSELAYVITRKRQSPFAMLYEIRLTKPFEISRRLPIPDGDLRGVAVSSKCNRIFVSDHGNKKIWIIDSRSFSIVDALQIDDYAPGTLAINHEEDMLAVLIPDSQRAFLVHPATGALIGQVEGLRPKAFDAEFTADGKKLFIATFSEKGGIAIIDVSPLFLPSSVVFASNRGGDSFQIYRMDLNGRKIVPLTTNHANNCCPRWSPDGRMIAFISDEHAPARIELMNRDGKEERPLEKTDAILSEDSALLCWSPDGSQIAFVGNEKNAVRVVDVKSGNVKTVVEDETIPGDSSYESVSWNDADGTLLISSQKSGNGYDHRVFQMNLDQLKTTEVYNDENRADVRAQPVVAPDGKRIAAIVMPKGKNLPHPILLINRGDGTEKELNGTGAAVNGPLCWSTDGKHLVYSAGTTDRQRLFLVGTDGQAPVALTEDGDYHDMHPDLFGHVPEPLVDK